MRFSSIRITTGACEHLRLPLVLKAAQTPGRPWPRPYLAPQEGLDSALMRAGHHHAGTVSVLMFLEEKNSVVSSGTHRSHRRCSRPCSGSQR